MSAPNFYRPNNHSVFFFTHFRFHLSLLSQTDSGATADSVDFTVKIYKSIEFTGKTIPKSNVLLALAECTL